MAAHILLGRSIIEIREDLTAYASGGGQISGHRQFDLPPSPFDRWAVQGCEETLRSSLKRHLCLFPVYRGEFTCSQKRAHSKEFIRSTERLDESDQPHRLAVVLVSLIFASGFSPYFHCPLFSWIAKISVML